MKERGLLSQALLACLPFDDGEGTPTLLPFDRGEGTPSQSFWCGEDTSLRTSFCCGEDTPLHSSCRVTIKLTLKMILKLQSMSKKRRKTLIVCMKLIACKVIMLLLLLRIFIVEYPSSWSSILTKRSALDWAPSWQKWENEQKELLPFFLKVRRHSSAWVGADP